MKALRPGHAVSVILVLLLPACGEDGASRSFTVRDSAGVEIVESSRPAWDEGSRWTVPDEALVRLGVVDGDPPYQLSDVTGAVRLGDGGVAVADAGSQEVRFFDREGRFDRAVGGAGGGPGEFTGLSGLGHATGGGLWAYDFSLRRITWMDRRGEVLRVAPLAPEPPVLSPVGALPDGTFVLRQLWGARRIAAVAATGLRRDSVALVRFDAGGTVLDTIALAPGREVFVTEEGGRPVMNTPVAGRNAVATVLDGEVVLGSQERFEVEVRRPDGRLLRILRIPDRDLGIEPAEVEALIQERLDATPPDARSQLREAHRSMPVPERRPAYGALLADPSGNLWVGEWAPFPRVPRRWTVIGPGGQWLGEIVVPEGFSPLDIGPDWILGLERDALDVEHVTLRRLEKPSPPGSLDTGPEARPSPAGTPG